MQESNLRYEGQNLMPYRLANPLCNALEAFGESGDTPIPFLERHPRFSATPVPGGGGVGVGPPLSPLPCSLAHLHALGRWLSMQCSPCRHPHILWSEDCILRIQYAKPLTHCAAMVCRLVQLNRITILLSWAYPCRMKRGSLYRLHYPPLAGLYSLHTAFA